MNDPTATPMETWYIVKMASGPCLLQSASEFSAEATVQHWGPYSTKAEAIAKRVGLIRSGKCKPA